MSVRAFYDALAPWYHAIFPDWDASMERQRAALERIIHDQWGPGPKRILDVAAGIGTQAIGLAAAGHSVVAGDLSRVAVRRCRDEASRRGFRFPVFQGDMTAAPVRGGATDVVLAGDNALPHLLSESRIRGTLRGFLDAVRPGGGCLVTMRDYGPPPATGSQEAHSYGERILDGHPYELQQTWRWRGAHYDLTMTIVDLETGIAVLTQETTYFTLSPARMATLMASAGFERISRIDGVFYQPVIVGSRPER